MRYVILIFLAVFTLTPGHARGAAYPDRPVRLIVPFPAGGGNDILFLFLLRL